VKDKLEKGIFISYVRRPRAFNAWNKSANKKGVATKRGLDLFAIRVILDSAPQKKKTVWTGYS